MSSLVPFVAYSPVKGLSEGAPSIIPEGASSIIPEGASSIIPEEASSVIREGASSIIPEGISSIIPEEASSVIREGASSVDDVSLRRVFTFGDTISWGAFSNNFILRYSSRFP
jgi:hypothetical protein